MSLLRRAAEPGAIQNNAAQIVPGSTFVADNSARAAALRRAHPHACAGGQASRRRPPARLRGRAARPSPGSRCPSHAASARCRCKARLQVSNAATAVLGGTTIKCADLNILQYSNVTSAASFLGAPSAVPLPLPAACPAPPQN